MPPAWVPVALLFAVLLGEFRTWRGYRERAAPSAQDAGSFRLNNVLGWGAFIAGIGSGLLLRGDAAFAIPDGPLPVPPPPSYAGGDLAFLGMGLSVGNWLSPVLYVVPWLVAHAYRIRVEERALLETIGELYRAYCQRTWRLVPFVW